MQTNYVIFGGAGYIGSQLARKLNNIGITPIIVDTGMFGYEGIAKRDCTLYKSYKEFDIKRGFQNNDYIVFLGGLSNDPLANYDPEANMVMNTEVPVKIAQEASQVKGVRFVFASSASVYGYTESGIVDEHGEIDATSNYASSKYTTELELQKINDSTGMPVFILRKATVMGASPRQRMDLVVNQMVMNAISKGEIYLHNGGAIWRPLVHVDDVCECYIQLERHFKRGFDICNLVHENYRISELGIFIKHLVSKKTDRKIELIPQYNTKEVRSYQMSGNKIRDVYNVKTNVGVEQAVDEIMYRCISDSINHRSISDSINADSIINFNIKWIENVKKVCEITGSEFDIKKMFSGL